MATFCILHAFETIADGFPEHGTSIGQFVHAGWREAFELR